MGLKLVCQIKWQVYLYHDSSTATTEYIRGKFRATMCQLSPSSAEW
jgi:hypothetical protein